MSNSRKARYGDPRKQSTTTKEHNVHQTMSDIAHDDTVIIEPRANGLLDRIWDFVFRPNSTPEHDEVVAIAKDAVKQGRSDVRQSRREVTRARRHLAKARRARLRFELACVFRRSANRLNVEDAVSHREMLSAVIKKAEDHLTNALALHETNKRALTTAKIEYKVLRTGNPTWLARHGQEQLDAYSERLWVRAGNRARFATSVRKVVTSAKAVANVAITLLGWTVLAVVTVAAGLVITLVVALKLMVTAVIVAFFSMVSMLAGSARSVVLA